MATSRSGSDSGWIAGALVFSGRPDPTWPIAGAVGDELVAIWDALPPTDVVATPPTLGYRGCYASDPAGSRWTAYHELVTFEGETRNDEKRRFERTVLGSAPEGILPPFTVTG
jgi:hypothetical protein